MTSIQHPAFDRFLDGTNRSVDELYDVLTAERRRRTIAVLADRTTPLTDERLARAVADVETDGHDETASETLVREVQIDLHHVHLPKLAAADLIEYDPAKGTVEAVDGNLHDLVPVGDAED